MKNKKQTQPTGSTSDVASPNPIPNKVYFVGIGGIGMSALAQLYLSKGMQVVGSDRGASQVTDLLTEKGVKIHIGHSAHHVTSDSTLIVYSDAVPEDNEERVRARELGIRECSYFEALGEATREGTSIVVSGTHGKTTTTAMIAKILIDAGERPTVIAGSILREYGSNFVAGRDDLFVIEGCEYRRHFLRLHPTILVITNIELDHTDYFRDLEDMQHAFRESIARVPENGTIVTDTASVTIAPILKDVPVTVVSFQDIHVPRLHVRGMFNEKNAQSAKGAVQAYAGARLPEEQIDTSLETFSGTWRRFEYKGVTEHGAVVFDDYAHHPTAVRGTLQMVRQEYVGKKIVVVFHPHLYSRTKKFFAEFVDALSYADEVLLLPVYAAREVHDPSVSSAELAKKIEEKGTTAHFVPDFSTAKQRLCKKDEKSIIITMGAGDVYRLGDVLIKKHR